MFAATHQPATDRKASFQVINDCQSRRDRKRQDQVPDREISTLMHHLRIVQALMNEIDDQRPARQEHHQIEQRDGIKGPQAESFSYSIHASTLGGW